MEISHSIKNILRMRISIRIAGERSAVQRNRPFATDVASETGYSRQICAKWMEATVEEIIDVKQNRGSEEHPKIRDGSMQRELIRVLNRNKRRTDGPK